MDCGPLSIDQEASGPRVGPGWARAGLLCRQCEGAEEAAGALPLPWQRAQLVFHISPWRFSCAVTRVHLNAGAGVHELVCARACINACLSVHM